MSTGSNIEWTQATWNPIVGCTRVSAGCDHCYAVTMTHRLETMEHTKYAGLTVLNPRGDRHFNGKVRCVPEALEIPLRWRKPRRIFVNSMSDLFHAKVPFEFIDKVFAVMALCPQHTFQILTKRPERMAEYFNKGGVDINAFTEAFRLAPKGLKIGDGLNITDGKWLLPNVWLGTSCEDQAAADERIPHLLQCPAAVKFLSCEPLLGPIDLDAALWTHRVRGQEQDAVDLVIVGGESGPGARPCDIGWIGSIVEQCRAAAVPCFVKQLGTLACYEHDAGKGGCHLPMNLRDKKGADPAEWPADLRVREMPQ